MKHEAFTEKELIDNFADSEFRLLKYFVMEKKMRICKHCGLDMDRIDDICSPNNDALFAGILNK